MVYQWKYSLLLHLDTEDLENGRVVNPSAYINRKSFFSVNLQAIVDKHSRFRNVSIKTPGSSHDALAHCVSDIAIKIQDNELPIAFWIAGDDAYGVSEQMIVPWPGRGIADDKDSFNFYQSRCRIRVVSGTERSVLSPS
jgi:hypothetical protein